MFTLCLKLFLITPLYSVSRKNALPGYYIEPGTQIKIRNACVSFSSPNTQMFAFMQTKCPGGQMTAHIWRAGIRQATVAPELSS